MNHALLVKSIGKFIDEKIRAESGRLILDCKELLGFAGGASIALAFIPQIWRLFKLKSAREISLPFTSLFLLGAVCWLSYGVLLKLPPVILWNAIGSAEICAVLYAKLKYGR